MGIGEIVDKLVDKISDELLRAQIVAVLNSPEVQQTNFVLEGVAVNGAHYKRVADAINTGLIRVRLDSSILRNNGFFGVYNDAGPGGVLTLAASPWASAGLALFVKTAIVHECTHAAMDLMKLRPSRGLKYTEYEGAAYIAEQVFIRRVTGESRLSPSDHQFLFVADDIAKRVIARAPHVYVVSHEDSRTLRFAIGRVEPYRARRRELKVTHG